MNTQKARFPRVRHSKRDSSIFLVEEIDPEIPYLTRLRVIQEGELETLPTGPDLEEDDYVSEEEVSE